MHILLVSNYFEPDSGAAAIRLSRLARALQQSGHQMTILTSLPHYPQGQIHEGYRRRLIVKENRDGMRVIQTWLYATTSPRISRKLISQLSFMLTASLRGIGIAKPDVVLIEAQPIFASLAGIFVALIKRRPYVLNVSDLWPDHLLSVGAMRESSRSYRLARRLVDFTYRHASAIIAMSPAWAERIQGYTNKSDNVHVIFNGVDLQAFRPGLDTTAFRQKYGLGEHKIIAFIGTFATQYDFDAMFEAASYFKHREDVQFLFIGRGSQQEKVQELLQRHALPNAKWLDWIDHAELPAAWNAAYLAFWVMGEHELYSGTIPAKLYEALGCGVPIAAATAGVTAEILQQSGAGMAVAPNDVNGLAKAMKRLLDDPTLYQQCSRAARRYAEGHYDPAEVARRYEAVLLAAAKRQDR